MLDEALELQLCGLRVATEMFGARNLITAKYYGNLGRLYQTRENFQLVMTQGN